MSEDCHDSNSGSTDFSCFDQDDISRRVKAFAGIIKEQRDAFDRYLRATQEPMAATEPDFLEFSEADKQFLRSMRIQGN